jgi:hypothetical protein
MDIAHWTLEDWADAATVLAAGATFIAAVIAAFAIRQARRLQDEKERPYVVGLVESNEHVPQFLELVIRNVGPTVAREIHVSCNPRPQRSAWEPGDKIEDISMPNTIPLLAPGQEWRTMWDSAEIRKKTDLPHSHQVTVKYLGLEKLTWAGIKPTKHSETFVLDWEHLYARMDVVIRTTHHIAKDIEAIKKLFASSVDTYGFKGTMGVRLLQENPSDT